MEAVVITKIISAGETGVDRAALDFAIRFGIAHGGWCPKGRRSESGRISGKYQLCETSSTGFSGCMAKNIGSSDGTLIISRGRPTSGTKLTVEICDHPGNAKPKFIVDVLQPLDTEGFLDFVRKHKIRTLNVAGPRNSKQRSIGKDAKRVLASFLLR
jgi:hypothetical protein